VFINENITNSQNAIDKKLDDGTKRNLYSIYRSEDDLFYYKYNEFNNLNITVSMEPKYLCEIYDKLRIEVQNGYDTSYPKYYTIKIDKAFNGLLQMISIIVIILILNLK